MPEFTYVLTHRTESREPVQATGPREVLAHLRRDNAASVMQRASIERVEVYDADGELVLDTDPRECEACGRNEHAGLRDGLPYCHRHL